MDPIETKPPDPTPSFRRSWIAPRSIFGLFLFLMGGLLMLDRFGYVDAHDWWRFWPLFPISIGVVKLLQPRRDGQRFFGGLLILIFGAILLRNLGWIPDFRIDGRLIFPAVLLWIGLAMMFSRHRSGCWGGRRGRWDRGDRALDAPEDSGSEVDSFAVLGSSRATSTSQNFRGGHATAVLGSYELDLRRAAIPPGEEAVINTVAVWGGVSILVPETWSVVMRGTPVLGGFDDRTHSSTDANPPRLVIKGVALMGGVEVKNRPWRER